MTWTLAMVNAFYHPYIGGSEKHMYELSRRLARKHNVVVITSRLENTPEYEEIDGVKIHRLDARLLKLPHIYPPPYPICKEVPAAIERLHKKYGFDFINIHGRWFPSFNRAIYFGKKNGIKTVLTLHNGRPGGIDPATTLFGTIYESLWGKKILRDVDRIIAVSEGVKKEIANYGIDEKKMHVIHNGVDTAMFTPTEPKYRERYADGFDHLLVFSGRIVKQKGLEHLLEAMKLVIKEYPKTRLLIIGKGSLRQELEKKARKAGIRDNVMFLGFLPENEMAYIYSSSDLFILPSISEPFGMVLVEAMASGLPCIGTEVGGIPEIIRDGDSGFIVPPKDPEKLAARIIEVLSDETLRKKMGRKGREIALKKFDWDIIAEKTERFYTDWYEVTGNKR